GTDAEYRGAQESSHLRSAAQAGVDRISAAGARGLAVDFEVLQINGLLADGATEWWGVRRRGLRFIGLGFRLFGFVRWVLIGHVQPVSRFLIYRGGCQLRVRVCPSIGGTLEIRN